MEFIKKIKRWWIDRKINEIRKIALIELKRRGVDVSKYD